MLAHDSLYKTVRADDSYKVQALHQKKVLVTKDT
jgi:hypothetical protein